VFDSVWGKLASGSLISRRRDSNRKVMKGRQVRDRNISMDTNIYDFQNQSSHRPRWG